jgi:cell division protein FtsB
MSEAREQFDLQRQVAETWKLMAEQQKLIAEREKLFAEVSKLDKERWWFPWLQLLTLVISSATIGALVARLVH